jgi:hypothetical protein
MTDRSLFYFFALAALGSCGGTGKDSPHVDTALVFVQTPQEQSPSISPRSPLRPQDLVVAGLESGMDSAAVRTLLGSPDSISADDDFRDPGAKLISWHYRDLIVYLGSYNSLGAIEIVGPGVATARGLGSGTRRSASRNYMPQTVLLKRQSAN